MTEAGEPKLSDLLDELRLLRLEQRAAAAEQRSTAAELRAGIAEARAAQIETATALRTRLDTVIDALADLRREYAQHTHDPGTQGEAE